MTTTSCWYDPVCDSSILYFFISSHLIFTSIVHTYWPELGICSWLPSAVYDTILSLTDFSSGNFKLYKKEKMSSPDLGFAIPGAGEVGRQRKVTGATGKTAATAAGLSIAVLNSRSPADRSPERPPVGRECRCCWMCEEAETVGCQMLVDRWACLDGRRVWSLDYKVR